MAEYTGPVAWVSSAQAREVGVDLPAGQDGFYVAMPDVDDWEDKGMEYGMAGADMNEPHPHGQLTMEEISKLPRVAWVAEPEKLETVQLPSQNVTLDVYGGDAPHPGHPSVTPPGQEGYTLDDQSGAVEHYTFGERTTQIGGGHFELVDEE